MLADQGAGIGEPAVGVEERGVPASALPRRRVLGELLADQQARPVGVDPPGQPGPGADQRLVGDLDRVIVHGDKPGARELLKHVAGDDRVGAARGGDQLGEGDAAARVIVVGVDAHQA
jgi:hypothetical protein